MKFIIALALFAITTLTAHAQTNFTPDQMATTLVGVHPSLKNIPGVIQDWRSTSERNRLSEAQREILAEFSRTRLPKAYANTHTVFYPFGGPDVIFPSIFFPNMTTLILAGLENPGSLATTITIEEAPQKITDVKDAYLELFKRGYFVTEKMSKELQQFGTATMISAGLKMLGHKIMKVEQGPIPGKSIRIEYTDGKQLRQVYYFQGDVSDKSISPAFLSLVSSFHNQHSFTSFYKASSYVPQLAGFSRVNDLALKGDYIVQSDTGLKITDLTMNSEWSVNLFGQYAVPAAIFKVKPQESLITAYANAICNSGDSGAVQQFARIRKVENSVQVRVVANPQPQAQQEWSWNLFQQQIQAQQQQRTVQPVQRQTEACRYAAPSTGNIPNYAGALDFNYDYAGKLSPPSVLGIASSLIYAERKK